MVVLGIRWSISPFTLEFDKSFALIGCQTRKFHFRWPEKLSRGVSVRLCRLNFDRRRGYRFWVVALTNSRRGSVPGIRFCEGCRSSISAHEPFSVVLISDVDLHSDAHFLTSIEYDIVIWQRALWCAYTCIEINVISARNAKFPHCWCAESRWEESMTMSIWNRVEENRTK
jgi:hypothetical protein